MNYPKTRYYDSNKQALPIGTQEGEYSLVCNDGWEVGASINFIAWDGDTPYFTTTEAEQQADSFEKNRKASHEQAAYAQQDSFFTPNKRHLFDGVVYNAPPADMALLPKMNKYRVFMKELWTEYHTRIANGSTDYDYSEFAPETEYSYVELEQEWADYNQVS